MRICSKTHNVICGGELVGQLAILTRAYDVVGMLVTYDYNPPKTILWSVKYLSSDFLWKS